MDRVLRVLICAARQADWSYELWTDGALREDAMEFAERAVPFSGIRQSSATVVWSPDTDLPPSSLPSVATLHDINPLMADGRQLFSRWRRRSKFRTRVRRCLDRADQLVTDTVDGQIRISEAFPTSRDRLSVVPLFADPDIQPLVGPRGAEILNRLAVKPGFILCVGSLRRHKNWEGLIRAFAELPAAVRSAHHLVFVGRAKRAEGDAQRLATSLGIDGQMHILSVVDEEALHALYGAALLLACPSFMEGFGFPPLEAMACGVPVVATNRTCVPEVLGDAPIYIDPASIPNMTAGLRAVIENPQQRAAMIAAGLRRAAEFNADRTARAMQAVLNRLHQP